MAKVVVLLKVLPAEADTDMEALKNKIEEAITRLGEGFSLQSYNIEPIAFGLKALRLTVLIPEEIEGGTYSLEETIKGIEGVSEVEVEFVSRLSQ